MIQFTRWRCKYLKFPYGDQGLFLTKKYFYEELPWGGYPNQKIMEDFVLVQHLKAESIKYKNENKKQFVILEKEIAECSYRRWCRQGVFWNTILNNLIVTSFLFLNSKPD